MSISWSRVRYMLVKEWAQMFRDPRNEPFAVVTLPTRPSELRERASMSNESAMRLGS